ncbi:MAG TPA: hypothetical protein VNT03_19370 [Baekduia sp.]|nr:hypothetical protein [Baekduia sp.]
MVSLDTSPTTTGSQPLRELAARHNDGIDVRLLWRPADDAILLHVDDAKLGLRFELEVARGAARNAFEHPFAYVDDPSRRCRTASKSATPATAITASTSGAAQTW